MFRFSRERTLGLPLALGCLLTLPGFARAEFSGLQEINPPPATGGEALIALTGGVLVDGRGGPPVPDAVVLIRGNRIVSAGPRRDATIPAHAERVAVDGCAVLPGLLDAHFHTSSGAEMHKIPPLFLSHGVTTARDPGRPIDVYLPLLEAKEPMPRHFLTGPHFDQSPPAWPANAVLLNSPAEARQAVDRYVEQGASAIKVYFRLSLESIRATCEQADSHGIPVTAHLELVPASDAILAGMDGIEHITSFGSDLASSEVAASFQEAVAAENNARKDGRYRLWATLDFESNRTKRLLQLLQKHHVVVSPTLATFEVRPGDEGRSEFHAEGFRNMLRFTGMCHRAGVTVVTGSHTWSRHVDFGWAYQREMELLVEAGMSPMEVIQASTARNAEFFGCAERLGTIEPGKLADLVVIKGRPHENVKDMYNVSAVMLDGRFVHRKGLASP